MKVFLQTIGIVLLIFLFSSRVLATSIEDDIKRYLDLIAQTQTKNSSLQKEITLLDSRAKLTSLRIDDAQNKIKLLDKEIGGLNDEIDKLEELKTRRLELVRHRIPQSYKRASISQFGSILLSHDFSELLTKTKYLLHVQTEDALHYKQLQLTQFNYNERKDTREKKKMDQEELRKQLEKLTIDLANQKKQKQVLLAQTQNDESTYQRLLSQARAQLAGFAKFSTSQGGGALSGQTSCDSWGCYYNQRDNQWGSTLINGSNDCGGPCNVERVGCLITSISMLASHLGHNNISPRDIATSDPSNFSVGTAMLKKGTISVKGTNITRVGISGSLSPDAVKDGPVVVGIYHGQFGTHFVVVKSYKDGKYIMNDPYEAGGHDISFTDHYSLGSVFSVERVSI